MASMNGLNEWFEWSAVEPQIAIQLRHQFSNTNIALCEAFSSTLQLVNGFSTECNLQLGTYWKRKVFWSLTVKF